MGAGKWIGGILGFMTMGPLGALAGFALGSLLDGNNGLFGNTYEKGQVEAGAAECLCYRPRSRFCHWPQYL